ncbi:MotA/TolQ/ExbB proton channel family protein [Puniceicoccaceae bacterium K14]|nr:MotA/TolQ/ExbB proton channel family protein [Puniceicoccaceae bacterium K14]
MIKFYPALFTFFSLWASKSLFAQEASNNGDSSLFTMISQGGWAMIPLGICSMTLIYLIIHCFRETRAINFGTDQLANHITKLCSAGRIEDAMYHCKNDTTLLGRSLEFALVKDAKLVPNADRLESFNNAIAEKIEIEENNVSQWIHYINVVAGVAPMVGLLGTVSGMIGAFQTMSSGGMGRPELLAGDIGEALITTATGLCIGIPAMIAYSYFNNRLNNAIMENAQRAGMIADTLEDKTQANAR